MPSERPDGALAGILYDFNRQLSAAGGHAAVEGHPVSSRQILDSYDRVLHPWMHGRRPSDLADALSKRLGREVTTTHVLAGALLSIMLIEMVAIALYEVFLV